jgi:hypothetical protein
MSRPDHCSNFVELMTRHIQGAAEVIKGNITGGFSGKASIKKGLAELKINTKAWHRAMVHVTESEMEGLQFKHLWEEHVTLEGQYIEAVFHCHCQSQDFGLCRSAQAAKQAVQGLTENGSAIVDWFSEHFSPDERQEWADYWTIHLQCVKDTIDTGRLVKCQIRTLKDFSVRAQHCLKLGRDLGDRLNAVRHPHS